jgi:hypothetical protein
MIRRKPAWRTGLAVLVVLALNLVASARTIADGSDGSDRSVRSVGSETLPDPVAIPLDGVTFPARLKRIDPQWNVTFTSGGLERTIPASELMRWGGRSDVQGGTVIVLAERGLLAVDNAEIHNDQLRATSRLWGEVRVPREKSRGIIFALPMDPERFDPLLYRMVSRQATDDQLVLENDDTVYGTLIGLSNQHLELATKSGIETVDRRRVIAVLFGPARVSTAPSDRLYVSLAFTDGSLIAAREATLDQGQLRIRTTDGMTFASSAGMDAMGHIVSLQTFQPRVTYLSDLAPIGFKHTPYLAIDWPLGIDRNVSGGQQRSQGVVYTKGLGMHSTSRVAYELGGQYRRFAAELALDDEVGQGGSVVGRVYVERKPRQWEEVYRSPVVRGGDRPVPVAVDVRGAERLALVIEHADRADQLDRANWLDARVVR